MWYMLYLFVLCNCGDAVTLWALLGSQLQKEKLGLPYIMWVKVYL